MPIKFSCSLASRIICTSTREMRDEITAKKLVDFYGKHNQGSFSISQLEMRDM